jgi:hypothetical protein
MTTVESKWEEPWLRTPEALRSICVGFSECLSGYDADEEARYRYPSGEPA